MSPSLSWSWQIISLSTLLRSRLAKSCSNRMLSAWRPLALLTMRRKKSPPSLLSQIFPLAKHTCTSPLLASWTINWKGNQHHISSYFVLMLFHRFYRSKYTNQAKEEAYMAVTQFEPTDARRAFPCWDEPALKASFDVTLVVPKKLMAISNMPAVRATWLRFPHYLILNSLQISEKEEGDLKAVTFDRSPIMSTYLLALIVGEFDVLEGKTPKYPFLLFLLVISFLRFALTAFVMALLYACLLL